MSHRCRALSGIFMVLALSVAAFGQYGIYNSRGLLEKKLYYIDENGKMGTCEFWSLNLGKHSCTVTQEFPGEGMVTFEAEANFNFLSSLYIEGKGYSGQRGKVTVDAKFAVPEGEDVKEVDPEQVEYVYDYGAKAKISGIGNTDLYLYPKGNKLVVKRMLLRIFVYDKQYKSLNFSKDVAIKAFSFSKAGIQEARTAK